MATDPQTPAKASTSDLRRLTLLLRLAEGTWVLAVYEDATIRRSVTDELRSALVPLPLLEISLLSRKPDPLAILRDLSVTPEQSAPVVCFTDVVSAFPDLCVYLDRQRESLAQLPHRLLFWVTEYDLQYLSEHAPNFYSRISGTFRFLGTTSVRSESVATPQQSKSIDSAIIVRRRRRRPTITDGTQRRRLADYYQQRVHDLQHQPRPDFQSIADAWYDLGGIYDSAELGQWSEAEKAYLEAVRYYAAANNLVAQADSLAQAGEAARRAYAHSRALEYLRHALHLYRLLDDSVDQNQQIAVGEADVLRAIGDVQRLRGEYGAAQGNYEAALDLYRAVGDRLSEYITLRAISGVQRLRGEYVAAQRNYEAALAVEDRLSEADKIKIDEQSRPLRMLMLIAAPLVQHVRRDNRTVLMPVTQLEVQEELDEIVRACKVPRSPVALGIEVEIATSETVNYVFATASDSFDILHFSGHGDYHSGTVLVLEDNVGMAREMNVAELKALLAPLNGPPCRLAFLSAPHSEGMAETLIAAGVQHVVVINAEDDVLDLSLRAFAKRFYPALLAGRSVEAAFKFAKAAVENDDQLRTWQDPRTLQTLNWREASKFLLLPDGAAQHAQPLTPRFLRGPVEVAGPSWDDTNLSQISAAPFFGRRLELHAIVERLSRSGERCCVVVYGPGGMGKTALAEAAGRWHYERRRYADGVYLVQLRNVSTSLEARVRIATELKLDPKVGADNTALASALRRGERLLILDDLDILLQNDRAAAADMLNALLGNRDLHLLITSRVQLPGGVAHLPLTLERLDLQDALHAFQQYAPVDEWGQWTQDDLTAVMRLIDGYPFPLRLAATNMIRSHWGLRGLRQRLEANLQGTFRYQNDEEDRNTSLATTLDLSYHSLPTEAKQALPLLALFPAGLTRLAARSILGEWSEAALERLLDYSMAEYRDADARFMLPEPARRYAQAHQQPDALEQVAPDALQFFHGLVDACNDLIVEGKIEQGRLLLTLEQPNLRYFLTWGYEHETPCVDQPNVSLSARATTLLSNYWTLTAAKQQQETFDSLQGALKASRRLEDKQGEANTLRALGDVQRFRAEYDAAQTSYEQALGLYRAVGARLGEANTLSALGQLLLVQGKQAEANDLLNQAMAIFSAIGDRYSIPAQIGNYGWALQRIGNYDGARPYLLQAAELFTQMGQHDFAERARRGAQASGSPQPVEQLFATLPASVREALQASDVEALQRALSGLSADQATSIVEQLEQAGIIGRARPTEAPDSLNQFDPLLQAIAAVTHGNDEARSAIEDALSQLEERGWHLTLPVYAIWNGQRDLDTLTAGLDEQDTRLIQRLLEMLQEQSH